MPNNLHQCERTRYGTELCFILAVIATEPYSPTPLIKGLVNVYDGGGEGGVVDESRLGPDLVCLGACFVLWVVDDNIDEEEHEAPRRKNKMTR